MPRSERSNQTYTITNNSQKRCYNCNATGHFSRNCPVRGRAVPVESHGRNKDSRNTVNKKVATIVPEKSVVEKQDKVAELHQALKQAEMEESLKEAATTTIHVVSPGEKNENNTITFGPTLTTEVSVEGRTVGHQ